MASKKQITWFFSKTGRQFAYGAACFSCVTSIACLYTPQTFALSKYIDIVHLYKDGIKADLPSQVKQTFDKCVAMVENSELKKNVLNPFVVFGYDLFHAGTTKSKFGISIGIPDNFKYKSEEDVDKDDIQVNNKPVEWNSDPGQKLSDALVLPENVQMFGICREILMAQTNKMYYDSFSPGMIIFMSYATASRINQNLNLHLKPASFRFVMYGLIGLFAVGSYFLIKDVTQVHFEGKIDTKLADFGPEMTRSGIEFYTKMMNRNVALRYFLGEEGEKLYSATGNENFFIRNKRMPLHMRKQYFEQRLSKYLAEKEEIEQPPSEKL